MENDGKKNKLKRVYNILAKKSKKFFYRIFRAGDLGRTPYHVGWLAPGKTLEDLRIYLHGELGFGKNNKEVKDREIVLSWRKLTDNHEQYILNIYRDGEIRGFYEKLPVTGVLEKPSEMGEKEAKPEFLKFLGEFSVDKKYISEIKPVLNQIEPEPEIIK